MRQSPWNASHAVKCSPHSECIGRRVTVSSFFRDAFQVLSSGRAWISCRKMRTASKVVGGCRSDFSHGRATVLISHERLHKSASPQNRAVDRFQQSRTPGRRWLPRWNRSSRQFGRMYPLVIAGRQVADGRRPSTRSTRRIAGKWSARCGSASGGAGAPGRRGRDGRIPQLAAIRKPTNGRNISSTRLG